MARIKLHSTTFGIMNITGVGIAPVPQKAQAYRGCVLGIVAFILSGLCNVTRRSSCRFAGWRVLGSSPK